MDTDIDKTQPNIGDDIKSSESSVESSEIIGEKFDEGDEYMELINVDFALFVGILRDIAEGDDDEIISNNDRELLKTLLEEDDFYDVDFQKKVYNRIEDSGSMFDDFTEEFKSKYGKLSGILFDIYKTFKDGNDMELVNGIIEDEKVGEHFQEGGDGVFSGINPMYARQKKDSKTRPDVSNVDGERLRRFRARDVEIQQQDESNISIKNRIKKLIEKIKLAKSSPSVTTPVDSTEPSIDSEKVPEKPSVEKFDGTKFETFKKNFMKMWREFRRSNKVHPTESVDGESSSSNGQNKNTSAESGDGKSSSSNGQNENTSAESGDNSFYYGSLKDEFTDINNNFIEILDQLEKDFNEIPALLDITEEDFNKIKVDVIKKVEISSPSSPVGSKNTYNDIQFMTNNDGKIIRIGDSIECKSSSWLYPKQGIITGFNKDKYEHEYIYFTDQKQKPYTRKYGMVKTKCKGFEETSSTSSKSSPTSSSSTSSKSSPTSSSSTSSKSSSTSSSSTSSTSSPKTCTDDKKNETEKILNAYENYTKIPKELKENILDYACKINQIGDIRDNIENLIKNKIDRIEILSTIYVFITGIDSYNFINDSVMFDKLLHIIYEIKEKNSTIFKTPNGDLGDIPKNYFKHLIENSKKVKVYDESKKYLINFLDNIDNFEKYKLIEHIQLGINPDTPYYIYDNKNLIEYNNNEISLKPLEIVNEAIKTDETVIKKTDPVLFIESSGTNKKIYELYDIKNIYKISELNDYLITVNSKDGVNRIFKLENIIKSAAADSSSTSSAGPSSFPASSSTSSAGLSSSPASSSTSPASLSASPASSSTSPAGSSSSSPETCKDEKIDETKKILDEYDNYKEIPKEFNELKKNILNYACEINNLKSNIESYKKELNQSIPKLNIFITGIDYYESNNKSLMFRILLSIIYEIKENNSTIFKTPKGDLGDIPKKYFKHLIENSTKVDTKLKKLLIMFLDNIEKLEKYNLVYSINNAKRNIYNYIYNDTNLIEYKNNDILFTPIKLVDEVKKSDDTTIEKGHSVSFTENNKSSVLGNIKNIYEITRDNGNNDYLITIDSKTIDSETIDSEKRKKYIYSLTNIINSPAGSLTSSGVSQVIPPKITAEQIETLFGTNSISDEEEHNKFNLSGSQPILDQIGGSATYFKKFNNDSHIIKKPYRKYYFTSDIHSDVLTFITILQKNGLIEFSENTTINTKDDLYNPEKVSKIKWVAGNTLLVIAGDLVDGQRDRPVDDPKGLYELLLHIILYNLRIDSHSKKSDIIFTIGNHDHALLYTPIRLAHYVTFSVQMFFHSLDVRTKALRPFYECSPYLFIEIQPFDKGKKWVCLHAGLTDPECNLTNKALCDKNYKDDILNQQKQILESSLETFRNSINYIPETYKDLYPSSSSRTSMNNKIGEKSPLWTRFYAEGGPELVCETISNQHSGEYSWIIVGHCPTNLNFKHLNEIAKYTQDCSTNRRGCVLVGCNDDNKYPTKVAFVDIAMSQAFDLHDENSKYEMLRFYINRAKNIFGYQKTKVYPNNNKKEYIPIPKIPLHQTSSSITSSKDSKGPTTLGKWAPKNNSSTRRQVDKGNTKKTRKNRK
jgi:hypothetical protein